MNTGFLAPEKNRLAEVDAAKALAIFLVIVGHLVPSDSMIFRYVFAFHMPVFFFLSGYTTRRTDRTFLCTVRRKSASLLIPFAVFALLGLLLMAVFPGQRVDATPKEYLVRYLYIAQPYKFGQVWFLVCLFFSSIVMFSILKIWSGKKPWTLVFVLAGFSLAGVFLYEVISAKHYGRIPWKLDSMLTAVSFMIGGYLFREAKIVEKMKTWSLAAGCAVLAGAVWFFGVYLNGYVNLCDCVYGNPLWYFLAAYSGSILLLFLGKLLARVRFLSFLGRLSMPVFLIHGELILGVLALYGLATGTSAEYIPDGPLVFLAAIVVYALSVPFALLYEFLRKKIRSCFRKREAA